MAGVNEERSMTHYISDENAFSELCKNLSEFSTLALDTEFIGERTYFPKLALIQMAHAGEVWLIDPLALEDLRPLGEALSRSGLTVIMHDAEIDLQILVRCCGADIRGFFDTQLAASFAGMKESTGLSALVRRFTGKRLSKGQQVTNWLKRPLSEKQLKYAASDVLHLERIHARLAADLERLGRTRILADEIEERRVRWLTPLDVEARFANLLDAPRLTAKRRELLRRLLHWREETAVRQDKPRRHILTDEGLTAIAEQHPAAVSELRGLRLVSERAAKRYGEEILRICDETRELPDDRLKRDPGPRSVNKRTASRVPLVSLAMTILAEEAGIAPGLIARKNEILELCRRAAESPREPDLPMMRGWRGELVGHKLWKFARGEASLRVGTDPNGPAVILENGI